MDPREIERQRNVLLDAVQKAYRKHHLEDDSIGWDELGWDLQAALCEAMTDKGYQAWVREVGDRG